MIDSNVTTSRFSRRVTRHRFMRFGIVGLFGMAVNMVIIWLLAVRAGLPVLVSSAIATEVAIINNFLLNDHWTFRASVTTQSALQRFMRFNGVALGGMLITIGLLALLHTYTPLPLLLANVVAIGAATLWNYAVNSHWTWRGAQPSAARSTVNKL